MSEMGGTPFGSRYAHVMAEAQRRIRSNFDRALNAPTCPDQFTQYGVLFRKVRQRAPYEADYRPCALAWLSPNLRAIVDELKRPDPRCIDVCDALDRHVNSNAWEHLRQTIAYVRRELGQ